MAWPVVASYEFNSDLPVIRPNVAGYLVASASSLNDAVDSLAKHLIRFVEHVPPNFQER